MFLLIIIINDSKGSCNTIITQADFIDFAFGDHANGILYFDLTDNTYDEYFIEQVKEGDRQCQFMWEYLVKRVIAQQKRIQHIVVTESERIAHEDDDTCIVFNLHDPRNPKTVFLTVANGTAGYDIVKVSEETPQTEE